MDNETSTSGTPQRSRRDVLRLTGLAAAAGGAAALAHAGSASAAGPLIGDGGDLGHGVYGFNPGPAFAGVYGESTVDDSVGVLAVNTANTSDAVGLRATAKSGTAIVARLANTAIDADGAETGVRAVGGTFGIDAESTGLNTIAVLGRATGGLQSVGVQGLGPTGVDGRGSIGTTGVGTTYGLQGVADTDDAVCLHLYPYRFSDLAPKVAPTGKTTAHAIGELDMDGQGNLWQCVVDGTPGTWRKIAGPQTAGAFHVLTPGRVYDSREALPAPGTIASPSTRTISVADRRNVAGGAVVQSNFVPAGATAVAVNVTVVSTALRGFLTLNPGGILTADASTINWTAAGQVIANGVIVGLNASRQITVVAGGTGTTHFVLDITGYYL